MRIALVCPYAWDAPGGVQVHISQLASRLRSRGHDTLVLTPSFGPTGDADVIRVGRPIRIRFNRSVAPVSPWRATSKAAVEALRSWAPDIVHVHEPFVPGPGMAAARHSSQPVVATFHAYAERSRSLDLAAPLLRPLWNRLAARIAVSRAAAAFVARRFPSPAGRIVPNGVEIEMFAQAVPAPLPTGRKILFVNRLDPRKGFATMIEIFRLLAASDPEVMLVVAGDGPERGVVGRLSSEARRRVLLLGNVDHEELPAFHAACDAFCAPATGSESFGIVLVEAMAAGVPVVASDIAGYREVVRHGEEGLLVLPDDPSGFAAALSKVLSDAVLAKRLGAAGRERAERYSWGRVAGEIERIYEEALG